MMNRHYNVFWNNLLSVAAFWFLFLLLMTLFGVSVSAYSVNETGDSVVFLVNDTELPVSELLNITFTTNKTNITYDVYESGLGAAYLSGNDFMSVPPNASEVVYYYELSIPENAAPGVYNASISWQYNLSVVYQRSFEIIIEHYVNLSYLNATDDFVNISTVDGRYFTYYDVELPISGEHPDDQFTIKVYAPAGENVSVVCDSLLWCSPANFSMPASMEYDYLVKVRVPANTELTTFNPSIVFSRGNKSATQSATIRVKDTPVEVYQIPTDFDRSIQEMTPAELQELFETLNDAAERNLRELEEANKTEVVEVPVEVDRYVPVTSIDRQLDTISILQSSVSAFNDFRAEQEDENQQLHRNNVQLMELIANTTAKLSDVQSDFALKEMAAQQSLAEQSERDRRRRVWRNVLVLFSGMVIGSVYLYRRQVGW